MANANQLDRHRLESLPHIRQLVFREQVRSTNDLALELAKSDNLIFPALVVAQQQTAGRGQPGRSWISGTGSLTCSFAVHFRVDVPPILPLAVGLAAAEAIENLAEKSSGKPTPGTSQPEIAPLAIRLKWPNDLRVNQKKLGGILVESLPEKNVSVIGIGLNVNNPVESITNQSDRPLATNLASLTEAPFQLTNLLLALAESIVHMCDRLNRPGDREPIRLAIEERLEFSQTMIKFELPSGERIEVRQLGIDPSGRLVVERYHQRETLVSGSIIV